LFLKHNQWQCFHEHVFPSNIESLGPPFFSGTLLKESRDNPPHTQVVIDIAADAAIDVSALTLGRAGLTALLTKMHGPCMRAN